MPASRADLLDNLGAALAAASADYDVRPFGRERGRDRAADVAGSSGNERGLVLESCAHLWDPFVGVAPAGLGIDRTRAGGGCPAFMPERNSELMGNRGWGVDDAACPESGG